MEWHLYNSACIHPTRRLAILEEHRLTIKVSLVYNIRRSTTFCGPCTLKRFVGQSGMTLTDCVSHNCNGHFFYEPPALMRVRTHDQNFVPLIICNRIVTLQNKCPVLSNKCPSKSNKWPFISNKCPSLSNKCLRSNKFPKFLRQNHEPGDMILSKKLGKIIWQGDIYLTVWLLLADFVRRH